ncbi:hypothetical protein QBC42DRAFT_251587 [Cladorrhinum samala]|uniref:Uncharacterized protein n=1 Tax=Cladorrhinum samala TaxID=585594 RepID=A0AAV9HNE1_9PEZI|nr:hypothetical protein QBC42DRAFT_251587 [Cladorrhinum samala]
MANDSGGYEEHWQWPEDQRTQLVRDRDSALTAGNNYPNVSDSIPQSIAMDNISNSEDEVGEGAQLVRLDSAAPPPPRGDNSAETALDMVTITRLINRAETLLGNVQNLNAWNAGIDAQVEAFQERTRAADAELATINTRFDASVADALTLYSHLKESIQELKEKADQEDVAIAALEEQLQELHSKLDGMDDIADQLQSLAAEVELRMAAVVLRAIE